MMYVMNDYELIYLIRTDHCELALTFMYQKYQRMIWKHIHNLHLEQKEHDDFHQEGIMMLHKAIQTFDEQYNKSFTRYFELILKRHFYKMILYLPRYVLYETTDFIKETVVLEEEANYLHFESKFERDIHERFFVNQESIESILANSTYSKKQIYNAIYRIREKYKIVI